MLLLFFIYIAFIGLGLPDSLFGTAWPAIYNEMGLPFSYGSFVTSLVYLGTMVSSMTSARFINRFGTGKVTAVSTGGSKVNIQSIQDGDYQLGFAQSDVLAYAWEGTKSFEKDGGTQDFRVLGGLYAETVQLITMNENIKSVEDLRGKSVSIGTAGSGVYFNAIELVTTFLQKFLLLYYPNYILQTLLLPVQFAKASAIFYFIVFLKNPLMNI